MADRVLHISWGAGVAGREERGMEVFNDALGLYGRMQQEGRIEGFDVALFVPTGAGSRGYISVRGTPEQLAAVREDKEFQRNMTDAELIVQDLCVCDGYINAGVAEQVEIYNEAIAKVPQMA